MQKNKVMASELFQLLGRLWFHIDRRRQTQFVAYLLLVVVCAFSEIFSLGALFPFLAVLAVPDDFLNHRLVGEVCNILGVSSIGAIKLILTITFVVAALLAGILRIYLLRFSSSLSYSIGSDISCKLYERSIYQPYWIHTNRNSSEIKSGLSKANSIVNVVAQCATIISSSTIIFGISVSLFVIEPYVALACISGFGASYVLIGSLVRKQLLRNGTMIAGAQTALVKAAQEGLGGIRDVILEGAQPQYLDSFREADASLRRGQMGNAVISACPRYIIESIAIVVVAIVAYTVSETQVGLTGHIPVLGVFALGAQRVLPALYQWFNAWAAITSARRSLEDVLGLLDQPLLPIFAGQPRPEPLPFEEGILFLNISYRYPGSSQFVFRNLNLSIPKGARLGLIGSTGTGKSTMLDLLMGLLDPTEGEILVDGLPIRGIRLRAWQNNVAHVPQHIYLKDASFAENIAIGVSPAEIDLDQVRIAAQQAQISSFIEQTSSGYYTKVGERGAKLSGGQRQRIGIARALYKKAEVIIFDEATSALDSVTESDVIASIQALSTTLTIITVAHRLSSLSSCSLIVELKNGEIRRHR